MRRCDHCKEEFEPRKQGRRQRFCPGGECRKANERECWRAGARVLNRRAAAATGRKRPTVEEKLVLLQRSIKLAQELSAAGYDAMLITRYSGEVNIEFWPMTMAHQTDMKTYLLGDMVNLAPNAGGVDDFELQSTPSPGSFNRFHFIVDGKRLTFDEAATLLAAGAELPSAGLI